MMLRFIRCGVTLVWLALFVTGCSIPSVGGNGSGYRDLIVDAGAAPVRDVYVKTERILNRYLYETVRLEESTQLIYFETRWQYRPPFKDEQTQGIAEGRTRLVIQARPRRAAPIAGASNLYRVQIVAENMVRHRGSKEWTRVPNSTMYKAYVRKIANDLESEFRLSMRQF